MAKAYQFFDTHALRIIRHSDYQRIYQQDMVFQPQSHQFDPNIAEIVSDFNQIDGVRTLASCQGVSGMVPYQNYEILTLSPHARYAYIWFVDMPDSIKSSLQKMPYYREHIYPVLQSTGDNASFLRDIRAWLQQSTA